MNGNSKKHNKSAKRRKLDGENTPTPSKETPAQGISGTDVTDAPRPLTSNLALDLSSSKRKFKSFIITINHAR